MYKYNGPNPQKDIKKVRPNNNETAEKPYDNKFPSLNNVSIPSLKENL